MTDVKFYSNFYNIFLSKPYDLIKKRNGSEKKYQVEHVICVCMYTHEKERMSAHFIFVFFLLNNNRHRIVKREYFLLINIPN